MKKIITLSAIAMIFAITSAFALPIGIPNFWYSGVAYNGNGQVIPNTQIEVLINLNDGANSYSEQFVAPSTVLTDAFGIFTVQVGTGAGLGGSLATIQMKSNTQLTVQVRTIGGSWVTVKGSALSQTMIESQGTAKAFTLPMGKGNNKQVLTSNGAGVTYWGEPTDWANPGVIGSNTPNSAAFTEAIVGNSLANKNANAALEVNSSSKGFLLPRLSTTQRDAIVNPASGMLIFNKSLNKFQGAVIGTSALDQSNPTTPYSTGYPTAWQSFTPSSTGILTAVDWRIICSPLGLDPTTCRLRVYQGEGMSGALLAESEILPIAGGWDDRWLNFNLNDFEILLNAGSKYTIVLMVPSAIYAFNNVDINNNYLGGISNATPSWDWVFKTYMAPKNWVDLN
jgi:hypothetical protein